MSGVRGCRAPGRAWQGCHAGAHGMGSCVRPRLRKPGCRRKQVNCNTGTHVATSLLRHRDGDRRTASASRPLRVIQLDGVPPHEQAQPLDQLRDGRTFHCSPNCTTAPHRAALADRHGAFATLALPQRLFERGHEFACLTGRVERRARRFCSCGYGRRFDASGADGAVFDVDAAAPLVPMPLASVLATALELACCHALQFSLAT